ncbi:toxin-antitoxin system HicB family antitoxin [Campylobacter californiensis]|uniref:toxin-antitoxin system HicB family antitoxin n=1 Tax=Campylobacter californiensis TaxID=1032243 RepID=UPI0014728C3F|nr:toxin-antitoxin system HicB family antitoxin [Campylobacter sp. RM12916]MBE3610528.1 toxin-antitoxin system HicB family antitoxin [Campylobacter sp. RM12916]
MAEEKETATGSYNLQIKIPLELKEKLEILAKEAGVSLNQYIMFMFIRETKK